MQTFPGWWANPPESMGALTGWLHEHGGGGKVGRQAAEREMDLKNTQAPDC